MLKAMVWSVLGLLVTASAAQADFIYSPVGYYPAPVAVQTVYSAPIPVGLTRTVVAPVVVARPAYVAPVVQTVYSAPVTYVSPVTYAAPVSTVSYSYVPAPAVVAAPVYVRPAVTVAPVVVPGCLTCGVSRESLHVRPYSSVYRASGHTWGSGYSIYERNTPHRTVIRAHAHGW